MEKNDHFCLINSNSAKPCSFCLNSQASTMEFPFGGHHHHHHHHHRDGEDNDERNPPPPHFSPAIDDSEAFYPAPSVHHVSHQPASEYAPPPPRFEPAGAEYAPPPPPPFFESHDPPRRPSPYSGDPYGREEEDGGFLRRQKTVRVLTKAEEGFSLSIRDGKVILAREDSSDVCQHWIKDMRYSTNVKDEESFPAFALVNKATGEAIKHSFGATHPVQLVPYNPNSFDESILWTESRDLGDGFRCIRMVNNISLNFDAFNGDEEHGGVHDGTIIVLWEWLKGKNQWWKIVPY